MLGLAATEGVFVYPRDDTYIHMAISAELAEHGLWSLDGKGFESCSSSPLYTILLALGFLIFGKSVFVPLFWNVLAGIGLLGAFNRVWSRYALGPKSRLLGVVGLIFLAPLPALMLSGLEHTLQIWIDFAFVITAMQLWEGKHSRGMVVKLLVLGMLVTGIRYEGMFLVAVGGGLFLLRGNWKMGLGIWVAGACSVVGFGLFAHLNGAHFFPNSLLVKGNVPPITSISGMAYWLFFGISKFYRYPHVWALLLWMLVLLWWQRRKQYAWTLGVLYLSCVTIGTLLIHVFFAEIGNYYRYEAYVVVLAWASLSGVLPVVWRSIREMRAGGWDSILIGGLVVGVFALPFMLRTGHSFANYPQAVKNIYEQQYQMAQFLQQYYPNAVVVANDVGAINYYTNIDVVDLVGIGSQEVLDEVLRNGGALETDFIAQLADESQAVCALVYDSWFPNQLPDSWAKVGEWEIQGNVTCGDAIVSFYGIDETERTTFRKHWNDFSQTLPNDVEVREESGDKKNGLHLLREAL